MEFLLGPQGLSPLPASSWARWARTEVGGKPRLDTRGTRQWVTVSQVCLLSVLALAHQLPVVPIDVGRPSPRH